MTASEPDYKHLLGKIDQWMIEMSSSKLVDSNRVVDMLLDVRLEFQGRVELDEPVAV